MKIKDGYILREVGSLKIVVAVGEAFDNFHKILTLNETGSFLWNLLLTNKSEEQLVKAMCEKYDTCEQTAKNDVKEFIGKLNSNALLDN